MAICPSCGEENPDKFRLCGFCGTPLQPVAPPEEERKQITVLFVDMVGSTSRGEELDPEDVRALLEPYYARLRRALERHGGTVEKFIGDAVVAVFGAPVAHEDDPERAVRAGLAILDEIQMLNDEDPSRRLQVRVGINTGEALVALGARVGEGEGMAWGDVMNTAARIQSAAPVNGVLVDKRTQLAAEKAITFEEAEPIAAKGKSEPVPVAVVLGAKEVVDEQAGNATPFVGREDELERLLAGWRAAAQDRRPFLATIVGPPGTGKTRLLTEFRSRLENAGVHVGRCLSYGEGITYAPITEIVRAAAGIRQGDEDQVLADKLGNLIEGLLCDDLDQLRTIASALANLVGVKTTPRGTYATTEISQAELHWGIRRFLELRAEERPLLLVLEDLHWAEATLVELVQAIAANGEGPIFVLTTSRPEVADVHPEFVKDGNRRHVLTLEPLGDDASRELLTQLLDVPAETVERLIQNAAGNPLFLEETARMLAESGGTLDDVAVPTSLQGLVGARLDALAASEKRVAQHSSVAGGEFWSGVVKHLEEGESRDNELESLERRDLVRERTPSTIADDREWAFKHAVVRDVAYGRLPRKLRVGLHVRFADWLGERPGGEQDFVEILAYHLEQACLLARSVGRLDSVPPVDKAVELLRRAGEKAESREGLREARRYYERALELTPEEEAAARLELRLLRGRTLVALGEVALAGEELNEVADNASALGRIDLRCDALIWLANIGGKRGEVAAMKAHLSQARALAEAIGDRRLMVRAGYESAQATSWFGGSPEEAIEEVAASLALAEQLDDRPLAIEGNLRLGVLFFNGGRFDDARAPLERCRALADAYGSLRYSARATYVLGVLARCGRDFAQAEALHLQAREWLERTGDTFFEIQNLRALADIALELENLADVERYVRDAMPLAAAFGGYQVGDLCCTLARALARQGRLEEAQQAAEMAVGAALAEDPLATAVAHWAQAVVANAEHDVDRAAALYVAAIRLFEENELWIALGDLQVDYAQALHAAGRLEDALEELRRARATFTRVDAAGPLAQIDATLSALVAVDAAP